MNSLPFNNLSNISDNPREFCIAAGTWYMSIGAIMVFLSTGAALFLALTAESVSLPPANWIGYLQGEHQHIGWRFVFYLVALLGGMFLSAIGIGLRSEKVGSSSLALFVTLCLVIASAAICFQMVRIDLLGTAVSAGLLLLASGFLFLTATGCYATFRKYPPPPNQNTVTPAQLEEMRSRRRRQCD